MKRENTLKQWVILHALVIVGLIAFIVLAGEEDPYNPMPMWKFFAIKGAALAVFAACVWIGSILDKKGLLPYIEEE